MGQERELCNRVKAIFLGLTIGALKQITASDESFLTKYNAVRRVVSDDYMQCVWTDFDFAGESTAKKALFLCMKKKLYIMSYFVIWIKSWMDNR